MPTENSYNGEVGDHFHVSPQRIAMEFRTEGPQLKLSAQRLSHRKAE